MAADHCDLLCLDLETAERIRRQRLDPRRGRVLCRPRPRTRRRDPADARRRSGRSRGALRVRPRLGRRALAESRFSPRSDAALARGRPLATGGKDGDVLAHREPAANSSVQCSHRIRACVPEQTTPLLQIGVARRLPLAPAGPPPVERARLERRARVLAWVGIGWHVVEALIALVAGVAAGSIALIGFGADSMIEAGRRLRRHLALHRQPARLEPRRAPSAAADRDQLLHPRRLRRHRGHADVDRRRPSADELGRDRSRRLHRCHDAAAGASKAARRHEAQLVRSRARKLRRRACVPIFRWRSCSASVRTRSSAGGGPTRSPHSRSQASHSRKAARAGAEKAARRDAADRRRQLLNAEVAGASRTRGKPTCVSRRGARRLLP